MEALETTVQTKECSASPSRVFEPELTVREVLTPGNWFALSPPHRSARGLSAHGVRNSEHSSWGLRSVKQPAAGGL